MLCSLLRSLQEWRKVARKRINERKAIKSFQDQLMNKKVGRSNHYLLLEDLFEDRLEHF